MPWGLTRRWPNQADGSGPDSGPLHPRFTAKNILRVFFFYIFLDFALTTHCDVIKENCLEMPKVLPFWEQKICAIALLAPRSLGWRIAGTSTKHGEPAHQRPEIAGNPNAGCVLIPAVNRGSRRQEVFSQNPKMFSNSVLEQSTSRATPAVTTPSDVVVALRTRLLGPRELKGEKQCRR